MREDTSLHCRYVVRQLAMARDDRRAVVENRSQSPVSNSCSGIRKNSGFNRLKSCDFSYLKGATPLTIALRRELSFQWLAVLLLLFRFIAPPQRRRQQTDRDDC